MWRTVKLGDVCDVLDKMRKPITKKYRVSGDIPYYGATGVVDWVADFIFNEKLVLVGEDGAKWGVGDATAFIVEGKTWVNNHAHVLRPHEGVLLHEWLAYFLTAIDLSPWVTGLTVPKLNQAQLRSIPIPLPPLAEQQRIVAKLDAAFAEIDRAVEIAISRQENYRMLAESTLTSIFNNFSKETETTLGDYYDVRDGTHDSPKYVSKGYPLVTSKNLKKGLLDLSNVKYISEEDYISINKRSAVHAGDVLMAMIGTIGNPIVITEEPSYSIKNVALFKTNKNQNPWFLKYYLEHPAIKAQMQNDAKGTTQKFVGLGYLRNFPINAPTLETQNDIVAQIDTVFQEIETLEQAIEESVKAYGALKSAILAQELQPPQSDAA